MAMQSEVGINMALRISPNMSWRRSLKYLVLSTPKNLVADESEVGINMPLGWLLRLPKDIVAGMSEVGIDVPFDLVLGTSKIVAEMKWILLKLLVQEKWVSICR
jgi:hypothetical protein